MNNLYLPSAVLIAQRLVEPNIQLKQQHLVQIQYHLSGVTLS